MEEGWDGCLVRRLLSEMDEESLRVDDVDKEKDSCSYSSNAASRKMEAKAFRQSRYCR